MVYVFLMEQSTPSEAQEAAPAIPAAVLVPDLAQPTQRPRLRVLFTKETAREMAIRSVEARRIAKLNRNKPEPLPAIEPAPKRAADFTARRLERVRLQLERVDAMLAEETDPARIDKLCAASSKLEEQERRLSDRSLPPVRRAQDQAPAKLGHGSSLFAAGLDDV